MLNMQGSNKGLPKEGLKRFRIFYGAFILVFGVIVYRAVVIHLFPESSKSLSGIAAQQYQKSFKLSPYRGTIFDRRGQALAISIKKSSLFVNPRVFSPSKSQLKKLSKALKISRKDLKAISRKNSYFSWLKRKVDRNISTKLMALDINGLHTITEPARFYPFGSLAAHIIGMSGLDDNGLLGIEKQYNTYLKGQSLTLSRSRDARGNLIFLDSALASPEEPGYDLHLTIDLAIQEITEKALQEGLKQAGTKKGFALVQDPHTGQILAMATLPSFNPNLVKSLRLGNSRNTPLVDPFEPGSVLKPLLVAEAMEKTSLQMSDIIDCEETGIYAEDSWRIRDSHPNGPLSVKDIIVKSSNIGTFKISDRFDPNALHAMYRRFGITAKDQFIGFPGQTVGYIPRASQWTRQRQANISFGQGIMTTALEISRIYGAFANGGKILRPSLISHLRGANGKIKLDHPTETIRQVIAPKTAEKITEALVAVVENGTASLARMDQYTVAGKTGTSEKLDPKTKAYSDHLRTASFIGYTPALDPHLVIYVVVDEPTNKPYYGGKWAAPIFHEIALKSLKYLNVPGDKPTHSQADVAKGILPKQSQSTRSL